MRRPYPPANDVAKNDNARLLAGHCRIVILFCEDQFVKWYVVPKKAVLSIEVFGASTVNTPAL